MKSTTQSYVAALLLAVVCGTSFGARAATLTATNTADAGPGSLRAALASASNGDIIDATGVNGTIILTSGELLITNGLTLNGPGPANLSIDGNYPNTTNRVFRVLNAGTVSIFGLTITNGNNSIGGSGGGVYNVQSSLTLSNCYIIGNSAGPYGTGGGILSFGGSSKSATLTLLNSIVSSNSAEVGGGIYNWGEVGPSTLIVVGSTISGNSSGSAGAGGIKNDGSPTGNAMAFITNSIITGNSTTGYGGGIQNDGLQGHATLIVVNSTLSGNSADLAGANFGGGGIFNNGASGGNAALTLVGSTLSANSAGSPGGAIRNGAMGGGINTAIVLNCTLSSNSAPALGGGIANSGTLEIGSTILSAGTSGSNISSGAGITSRGYNLSSDSGGGFLTNATDQININPMLGPLQGNGGLTFTHALLSGSPAIDKGKNLAGNPTDQRGFPRTFEDPAIANATGGDGTDIGAYEVFVVRITSIEKMGDDLRLSFTSLPTKYYELQTRTNLLTGDWTSLGGNLPGNGSIAQVTVTNAFAQPQQFYRLHQSP